MGESYWVGDMWGMGAVPVLSAPEGLGSSWSGLHGSLGISHGSSHLMGMSCCSLVPSKYLVPTCDCYREGAAISAVCAFRPQDIRTVLNGPFRDLKHDCNRGLPVMDNDVPQPRPGEVRGWGISSLHACIAAGEEGPN